MFYAKKKIPLTYPLELVEVMKLLRGIEEVSSIKDEVVTLMKCKALIKVYLDGYETSMEEDKVSYAKAKEENNFNLVNIYQVLIEEKKVKFIKNITLDLK